MRPTCDEQCRVLTGCHRPLAVCLLPFVFLATINSAGYRYGASDQAFYAPAILKRIDPALYPRDSRLIRSQARLTLVDDVLGPLARATGVPLPAAFVVLQIASLSLARVRRRSGCRRALSHRWAAVALMAALTLRHAITKSGTNTLEGYFHPRQLAFAIGALAIVSFLRGRYGVMWVLVAVAATLHPDDRLWFAIWLGVATVAGRTATAAYRRRWASRWPRLAGAWALVAGPLAGRLVRMDPVWLETLGSKDYLFPLTWPATAWLVNLGYMPIISGSSGAGAPPGCSSPRESALVAGCLSLVLVFAATLPLNAARRRARHPAAASAHVLDARLPRGRLRRLGRGRGRGCQPAARAHRLRWRSSSCRRPRRLHHVVEFPDRRVAQVDVGDGDWGRAMAWARATPPGSGWLADPGHAARYGTSVRVAAERDVFVEAIKDGAVGMYDRAVAMRTRERVEALGEFTTLTPERARELRAAVRPRLSRERAGASTCRSRSAPAR